MINFRELPKILRKPREAFEELKEETTAKDGMIIFFLVSIVSLIFYYIASKTVDINVMAISFGFGPELNLQSFTVFFPLKLITFFAVAVGANALAKKYFRGEGTLGETIGFLGYANVITFIFALASIAFLYWSYIELLSTIQALQKDIVDVSYFQTFNRATVIITTILSIWSFWISGVAVSVEHNISTIKGIIAIIIPNLIIAFVYILIVRLLL